MKKAAATLSLLPVLVVLSAAVARADTITFNNDPIGIKANGFRSVDSNLVRFSTSPSPSHPGEELFLFNFGGQIGNTNALAVRGETAGDAANIPIAIILDFDVPVSALSLDYGNDSPGNAILTLYRNGVVVGQVVQATNGNTAIDQTISFSFSGPGEYFDRATFAFDFGNPEIIDNVTFTQATGVSTPTPTPPPPTPTPPTTTPVPEPATLLLLGSGLAGLALRRRRSRAGEKA